jgi:cytochrome o ubiquinol oxidase subunit IV
MSANHSDHAAGEPHSTRTGYLIGFGLSVVLTAIPFWLVMTGALGNPLATGYVIMGFALVQVIVHMIFFLHLNGKVEGGWTVMALIFTLILVVITLVGSLWVMYHMNANMMPGSITGDTGGM